MLSKISLGISAILVVVVIGMLIYISGYSETDSSTTPEPTQLIHRSDSSGLTIAFIYEDSLLANYTYYQEQEEEFERKQKAKALRYNQALTEYQNEMAKWQDYLASPGATERDMEMAAEDMDARSVTIQNMEIEIEKMALEFNDRIFDRVSTYLDRYAESNGIDLILNYKKELAVVLYSNSAMDITEQVAQGLNDEYEQEKLAEEE